MDKSADKIFEDEIIFEMEDETMSLFDDGLMIDTMADLPTDDKDCIGLCEEEEMEGDDDDVL